jgi:5-methyltetrahydrofolate corrinoid/iron sulfur protein methyltransferase
VILAADNIQALNPVVADALRTLNPKSIQDIARRCEQNGAQLIDINPGWLSKRNEDRMAFLVEAVQEATDLPLILDSPRAGVLARGLAVCRKKPILNALSLEERKIQEILPLAAENKCSLVLLLMDERSFTPPLMEEKIAIALELRERSLAAGLANEDLIFDPVLPNLSWEDAFLRVREGVKTIRLLSGGAILDEPAHTMAGLSNLRSGMSDRYPWRLEETCFHLLAGAGLGLVLANVLRREFTESYNLFHSLV